jgi:cell division protein FtsB
MTDHLDRLLEQIQLASNSFNALVAENERLVTEIERLREQLDIARLALSASMLGDIPP